MLNETEMNRNESINHAFQILEEERRITKKRISEDIWKMSEALSKINDMSTEGNLIREDLLGLLEYEADSAHNVDSLMIERHIEEKEAGLRILNSEKKPVIQ